MSDKAFFAIFPFMFVGMWLLSTTLMRWMSGWASLQERFPDRVEAPLKRLFLPSGMLGKGSLWNPWGNVNFGNTLRLEICPSGLRVALWRVFGLFSKPFFVPWKLIAVEERRVLFMRVYRLSFGDPNLSALTIRRRTFSKIEQLGFLKAP